MGFWTNAIEKKKEDLPNRLEMLGLRENAYVMNVANSIEHHPRACLREVLQAFREENRCMEAVRELNNPSSYRFDEMVSAKEVGRALSFLEVLARATERIGGRLDDPLESVVLGETVQVQFEKSMVREPHTKTDEELRRLEKYEQSRSSWDKPRIRFGTCALQGI